MPNDSPGSYQDALCGQERQPILWVGLPNHSNGIRAVIVLQEKLRCVGPETYAFSLAFFEGNGIIVGLSPLQARACKTRLTHFRLEIAVNLIAQIHKWQQSHEAFDSTHRIGVTEPA